MRTVEQILMDRDGMTREEAAHEIEYVHNEMMSLLEQGDVIGAEEFFVDNLGLEPDYIPDFLC